MGFPFFQPIYFTKTRIIMFGCPFAQASIKQIISKIMAPPNFPVNFEDIRADIIYHDACEESFTIKSMSITPIPLSHPNQGLGYRFTEDGKSFVFLTDNELTFKHPGGVDFQDYCDFSAGADLLVHDAEFTEEEYKKTKTWGHSVYRDALRLALEAGVRKFGLFHHNQERSDEGVDEIVADCRKIVANNNGDLECFAVHQGMEIEL
jgi:phosphoribosyl 1,2-cyclic phosphodiesterase